MTKPPLPASFTTERCLKGESHTDLPVRGALTPRTLSVLVLVYIAAALLGTRSRCVNSSSLELVPEQSGDFGTSRNSDLVTKPYLVPRCQSLRIPAAIRIPSNLSSSILHIHELVRRFSSADLPPHPSRAFHRASRLPLCPPSPPSRHLESRFSPRRNFPTPMVRRTHTSSRHGIISSRWGLLQEMTPAGGSCAS